MVSVGATGGAATAPAAKTSDPHATSAIAAVRFRICGRNALSFGRADPPSLSHHSNAVHRSVARSEDEATAERLGDELGPRTRPHLAHRVAHVGASRVVRDVEL